MAEWLVEAGIGETRAALVVGGVIVEGAIELDGGGPRVGTVLAARLVERLGPGLARVAFDGGEAMLDRPPPAPTLGASLLVEIVREPIPERGRPKLAKAVAAPAGALPQAGATLAERLAASGVPVRQCRAHEPDLLEAAGWSELLAEAETGEIAFPGGALRLALTPAMTVIDVDGSPPLDRLAVAGATAAARAIVRLGIGGAIGIDFPTLPDKAARQAVAQALDAALPQPFERTAVNGFGFLQIVRRRIRPSLAELIQADPVGAAARAALRRAERTPPGEAVVLDVSAAGAGRLRERPEWLAELERRTGRAGAVGMVPFPSTHSP